MKQLRPFWAAAGAALLLLAVLVPADAQVFVNRGVNPWTGNAYRNVTVRNPWTGRVGSSTAVYNPWTGTTFQNRQFYNPWTGRGVSRSAVSNPWTGMYRWGARRW
jgi:hypothetical protein